MKTKASEEVRDLPLSSAGEAVRFVRLLHRNIIFYHFDKGGKEEEKSDWKTLAMW